MQRGLEAPHNADKDVEPRVPSQNHSADLRLHGGLRGIELGEDLKGQPAGGPSNSPNHRDIPCLQSELYR